MFLCNLISICLFLRLCGPRTREVVQRANDWGSMCVDEYEILSITGEGTFGQVYKAKDKITGDIYALKKVSLLVLQQSRFVKSGT